MATIYDTIDRQCIYYRLPVDNAPEYQNEMTAAL